MLNETPAQPRRTEERLEKQPPIVPPISLPKSRDATPGMGEMLAADPATGTRSMTVSVATLSGRSGFGPRLKLAFDSGSSKVRKLSARADLCTRVGLDLLRGRYFTRCRLGLLLSSLFALLALSSCHDGRPDTWPAAHLKIPPVSTEAYRMYKMSIDDQKNVVDPKCVVIDGQDIQLPLTSGNDSAQDNRTYSFYVWAYNSYEPSNSLAAMRQKGTFSLEVVGVKAEIRVPNYLPAVGPPQRLLNSVTNDLSANSIAAMESRNVLEVRVRSQDITTPFSIVAWFPTEYIKWKETEQPGLDPTDTFTNTNTTLTGQFSKPPKHNPWGERRDVKVYNGDLRTHIDIVDEREAEASFGTLFPKYFYIGRVYLRNRHQDKRLVVYTTSLRANVLMYRPPLGTNQARSPALGSPKAEPAPHMGSFERQSPQSPLTADETNILVQAASNRWSKAQTMLNRGELKAVLGKAFEEAPEALELPASDRQNLAFRLASRIITTTNTVFRNGKRDDAVTRMLLVWTMVEQTANSWKAEAKTLQWEAEALATNAVGATAKPLGKGQERAPDKANRLLQQIAALAEKWVGATVKPLGKGQERAPDKTKRLLQQIADPSPHAALAANYSAATNWIAASTNYTANERKRLGDLAKEIYEKRLRAFQDEALAAALRDNSRQKLFAAPSPDGPGQGALVDRYNQTLEAIRGEVSAESGLANPFDKTRDILVNTEARALAFSESSDRQVQLANVGYLWRETYRPMTFQAVLNSLMYVHDNSWSARTIKILQSLATVAGGMVGLGTVINEFSSTAYLQSVNLFSTIFVPELGKLILDDLNKHIRNLGQMAMDTVVVIPPNDVVDHYVFFPKGPIYNFVQEFDVTSPAYIKTIDNDDVGVEATLIEQGVAVRGGGLDAATLVGQALNEGQPQTSVEADKQAALSEKLRSLELATLGSRIEDLLTGTEPAGTNGTKTLKRVEAERQVCEAIRTFEDRFGEDTSGTLAMLQSRYQVDCKHSPPLVVLSAIPKVEILAGVRSRLFDVPVADSTGPWNLQITNTSSNPDLLPSTNVVTKLPAPNSLDPVRFSVQANATSLGADQATPTITFTISNPLGLSTVVKVPVIVHPAQFEFRAIEGITNNSGTLELEDRGQVALVDIRLPTCESEDSTNWAFKLVTPAELETDGWSLMMGPPEAAPRTDPASQIARLTIDASLSQTNKIDFAVAASYGTNQICRTNIHACLKGGSPR